MNNKSIDENALKAIMALETVDSHLDEIFNIMDTELRIANTKGDTELANFISEQMKMLSTIENRIKFGKEYLKNLMGLSWGLYGGDITLRNNDDTDPEN